MLEKKTNSIFLLLWKQFPLRTFAQGHGDFLVVRHTLRTRPKEILDCIFLGWEQFLLDYKSDRISVRSSPVLLSPASLFLTVLLMLIGFCCSWDFFFFLRTSLGSRVKSQWNAPSQFLSPNAAVPMKPGLWNPAVSRRNSQMTVWESSWRNRQVLSSLEFASCLDLCTPASPQTAREVLLAPAKVWVLSNGNPVIWSWPFRLCHSV